MLVRSSQQRGGAAVPGRWVILLFRIVGVLVLGGYLMTSQPSTPNLAVNRSYFSSMTDVLKDAFGAALALAWAVGGAWFGVHRARVTKHLDEPAEDMRTLSIAYASLGAPNCEGIRRDPPRPRQMITDGLTAPLHPGA